MWQHLYRLLTVRPSGWRAPLENTDYPTAAYMGPNDLRYFILTVASMKVGLRLLLPSLRNNGPTQAALLDSTSCTSLIRARGTSVEHIMACKVLSTVTAPELQDFLGCRQVQPYPFDMTFEAVESAPTVIFHSSGSTSFPKPIIFRHGSICTLDNHNRVQTQDGKKPVTASIVKGARVLNCFPLFHVSA